MRSPVPVVVPVGLMLATVVSVSNASTTTLRRGGADADDKVHHENNFATWPFHSHSSSDVKDGITFERTETLFPLLQHGEEASMWRRLMPSASSHIFAWVGYYLRFSLAYLPSSTQPSSPSATFDSGHCQSSDEFGGNVCHYDWDDDIAINYDGRLGQEQLDEDIYIEMSVKIDSMIHHTQTCPICGDDPCTISGIEAIPKLNWSLELPPCPLTPDIFFGLWKTKLPGKSPIPGVLNLGSGGTVIDGTVWLKKKRNGQSEDGGDDVLMEVKGNVHVK